uniref:NAC transcription factor n=1 Tax=Suaeda liaotungensis TaxID=154002 RepID=A0A0M4N024_9CARY|nr:NAC transcription factor [Suaeda liaotungensis]
MAALSSRSRVCDEVWPPGFRFHPTDEELILYYLKRKISRRNLKLDIIADVDVYKCEPQQLPGLSVLKNGDRQWFFFSPRDRKYPNGSRSNRATRQGYWKATGKDRTIACNSRNVGIKKTLVFYEGRAPTGHRTDWVMHEYVLDEDELKRCQNVHDYYVLYKLFKKSGRGPKNGEQYGAPFREEDWPEDDCPNQQLVNVSPTYSCMNAQEDCSVSDIGELLNDILDDLAPMPLNYQSAPFPETNQSAPLSLNNELALSQPNNEPAPLQQMNNPASLQLLNEPAPVNIEDFEEALSQFLGQDNQGTETTLSFEGVNKLVVEDDFIEMDDLLGPEPAQSFTTLFPKPTGEENISNYEFHLEDGLSEFDLYHDADVHIRDLATIDPTDVHCTTSQDTGSVNQVDFEVLSYPSQVGLQSYSDGISSFESETWSYDSNSCLVNSTETGFTPLPSTGVVYGGISDVFTELNQNEEIEQSQPWSSLWSFVDSIPAAPASATESALLNKAFQRMSSFGRIRINSRRTMSPAAGSNKPSSVGVAGRMKGYFLLSFLAALFAIACVFFGSKASFFGKLHCGVDL